MRSAGPKAAKKFLGRKPQLTQASENVLRLSEHRRQPSQGGDKKKVMGLESTKPAVTLIIQWCKEAVYCRRNIHTDTLHASI